MAEYRVLLPTERPPVDLWTEVFGVEERFFTSLLEGGEADDNVSVAALEGDLPVASVHIFMRRIRDREGRPLKVGGIGSVSTHPEHRKHGHSGRLLELALDAMAREGCVWSFLGTGVNDHYARYGWRTVSTPHLTGRHQSGTAEAALLDSEDDATLAAMAELYERASAARPMATVRSERVWQTPVRYRLRPSQAAVFGAHEGDRLAAYVAVQHSWETWSFADAAGDEARYPELFAAASAWMADRGVDRTVSQLPPSGAARAAFEGTMDDVRTGESRGEMIRPIADRISWPDLFALYGDPRGRHSPLDAF